MNTLFTELKRRNIFRVAGVYAVVGWILMQVVAVMTPALNLPDWVDSFLCCDADYRFSHSIITRMGI